MPNLDKIKEIADQRQLALINAVIEAGDVLKSYWPGNTDKNQELSVETKEDGSVVTTADFKSNEILLEALERIYPEVPICSEETEYDDSHGKNTVWYVDPLDGTSHFVNGEDDFSILVGLCDKGVPSVGIIYFPILDILVFSAQGKGAYANNEKLSVSKRDKFDSTRVSIRRFEPKEEGCIISYDSGYGQFKVATGDIDACVIHFDTFKVWDLVAPSAIILNSGGQISDESGNPFDFEGETEREGFFIASNSILHSDVLSKLI